MNTKINYLYRDGSNYKSHNKVVVAGEITAEHLRRIADTLNEGEYFIPSVVGLPENRFETWTDDDHFWYEWEIDDEDFDLDASGCELTDEQPTVPLTVDQLVENFEKAQPWVRETTVQVKGCLYIVQPKNQTPEEAVETLRRAFETYGINADNLSIIRADYTQTESE